MTVRFETAVGYLIALVGILAAATHLSTPVVHLFADVEFLTLGVGSVAWTYAVWDRRALATVPLGLFGRVVSAVAPDSVYRRPARNCSQVQYN